MCTAFSFGKGRYFGRNLDLEYRYDERVVSVGREFPLVYKHLARDESHYAMIGIATVMDGYPLFYDGMNEHGLAVAALHFVGNAVYHDEASGAALSPYEVIPYVLSRAKTVKEARELLSDVTLVKTPFRQDLPLSELHFLISDREFSLVVEPRRSGLKFYRSPQELLTNNPPYAFHLYNLQQYRHMSATVGCPLFSRGLEAFGLPGDFSSSSRFLNHML